MKKIAYLTCLALAGSLMTSCELDAPNQSTMSEDVIFSTEELANLAVMGLHQSFGETNSYRGRFIPYFGTNTDCEIYNNYAGVAEPALDKEASLACYSAHYDNTYMNTDNNAWAKLYEAIERANKAVASMQQYGNIENNANMAQIYGELLTLRAMIYFDLVKAWGDVPYRFEPITTETIYLPKTDRVTIMKKMLEDLLEAEKYLGWPGDNSYTKSTERVSKSFAKGLRARTALFLAGMSEWPNEGLRYNLTDENERQEMYRIAYEECMDVINSGKNTLGTFEANFRALCEENTTAGAESIFEIPFSDGRGRVLYTWGGKHSTTDRWTDLNKGGVVGPTPTLWYDFDKNDVRRNITCLPYQWKDGKKTVGSTSGGGWSFGKLRFEWMKRKVTSTNDDGINFQVMRYADIYLMAAEAANELGNINEAQTNLKKIVDRAYPAGKANQIMIAANSKQAIFQTIVDQRKFEFAGEAIRKVDLMRWGLLSEKLAEQKAKMIDLANRQCIYANYPQKVYFADGLGAREDDADSYYIYGLEYGDDDEIGKAMQLGSSSALFCLGAGEDADKIKTNDDKINAYIQYLYINDPNSKMFWPIWKEFLNNSNGLLKNDYGYEN